MQLPVKTRILFSKSCKALINISAHQSTSKKSETELTASVLKKISKTHERLKERFLIRQNRTKRANFRGKPLFQATYNNATENS